MGTGDTQSYLVQKRAVDQRHHSLVHADQTLSPKARQQTTNALDRLSKVIADILARHPQLETGIRVEVAK